jgi:hypothetical protein
VAQHLQHCGAAAVTAMLCPGTRSMQRATAQDTNVVCSEQRRVGLRLHNALACLARQQFQLLEVDAVFVQC